MPYIPIHGRAIKPATQESKMLAVYETLIPSKRKLGEVETAEAGRDLIASFGYKVIAMEEDKDCPGFYDVAAVRGVMAIFEIAPIK
jgi:hypothetical protein